ncbi:MAG: NAD(P)-dependent oxidoreductase [Pedobacter sp.]|nr:MAG: NAD(P)-dependent oxidoreductase [Pedobacter sp.]
MKKVLITGAYGFLGRHTAKKFKELNFHVTGIGHGKWYPEQYEKWGLDKWLESTITFEALMNIKEKFDVIIHCGGSGSVAFSYANPYEDFQKSVQSTLSLLEFIRLQNPKCKFIYPSSPAVQGNMEDFEIKEDSSSTPISPYGYHKRTAEELCLSYHKNFGLKVGILRFFSIYGEGLEKQLLYDACKKIYSAKEDSIMFFGTGKETRDWINVDDASALIYTFSEKLQRFDIINGATGNRTEIKDILELLVKYMGKPVSLKFNGKNREGDPLYFWANMDRTLSYGWKPKVSLEEGIKRYVAYFKSL